MKHLFVPYEIALSFKEKGFDDPCFASYSNLKKLVIPDTKHWKNSTHPVKFVTAPLYQQAIDWLREKNIRIVESPAIFKDCWLVIIDANHKNPPDFDHKGFLSLDKAIEEALKLIK